MSSDQEIYAAIGELLSQAAPASASQIIMRASLSKEGDVGKFEYDIIDKNKVLNWFTADGRTNSALLDELTSLRSFFISQNQPAWENCSFSLNLETGKFEVKFDPLIE